LASNKFGPRLLNIDSQLFRAILKQGAEGRTGIEQQLRISLIDLAMQHDPLIHCKRIKRRSLRKRNLHWQQ